MNTTAKQQQPMKSIGTVNSQLPWKVIFAFAMIYIVWGSTFFFIHKALAGFGPFLLGAVRFTTAGLILLTYFYFSGHRIFHKPTILRAGLMGLLLLYIDNGIIIWVEQYMPSGLVAIMTASAAIWFIVLDKPNWKANFSNLPVVFGVFMGFFGVVMLFGDRVAQAMDTAQRQANITGMVLLLLGAMAWTIGSLYAKYYGKSGEAAQGNSMVGTAWQMLLAGIVFAITAGFRGEIADFRFEMVPSGAWWAMVYLIVMGSIVAYSSYIWLLQVRPATQVSTHTYVNPIVAVLLGAWFASETVTSSQIMALVIILLSVLLVNWDAYNLSALFSKRKSRYARLRDKVRTRSKLRASIPVRANGCARQAQE
ncbi:Permease of the drug/metabolite transporter (DMT) superfamily [Parapedobacter composti]|uniref:Permease of the drug/metabolite transporter (DMT) superfamily n=1 Tax=Parapedobacter composti TaxID=623281 RepID=A0A1I1HH54_9SPHI|nr:EamA family transporter [Parapedobacter composti]SFC22912.1 Permease of the drug/metabolite transporter (DMT) superfamily [Parapedobacter composti]